MDLLKKLMELCMLDETGKTAETYFRVEVLPYVIGQAKTANLKRSIAAQQREMAAITKLTDAHVNHFPRSLPSGSNHD